MASATKRSATRATRTRNGLTAVAGMAAAVVLAACGSTGGSKAGTGVFTNPANAPGAATTQAAGDSANAVLTSSVDKTFAAKNAKVRFDVKSTSNGKPITIGGDGVLDLAQKKFALTTDLPADSGISGELEIRVIGNVLYVKLPANAAIITGGKPWIKVGAAAADNLGSMGALSQDPTQLLSALRSVSSNVTTVGTEDVRGVTTTHYRAVIDLAKAARSNPDASQELDRYKAQLGSTSLPANVWIDKDGYLRRLVVTITPPPGSVSAADGAVTVSVEMYDFGQADTSAVEAPPADEVGTLPTDFGNITG